MADSPSNWQPPWLQLPGESRALIEWLRKPHAQAHPEWPQGQGIPVLVIPGFGQSAKSTTPLRKLLKAQGFVPYDWAQGRNMGLKSGMTAALLKLISTLHEKHQHKLALIGCVVTGMTISFDAGEPSFVELDWEVIGGFKRYSKVVWPGFSAAPLPRHVAKIGRNDPCPCGSGKKFKKCCLGHTPKCLPPRHRDLAAWNTRQSTRHSGGQAPSRGSTCQPTSSRESSSIPTSTNRCARKTPNVPPSSGPSAAWPTWRPKPSSEISASLVSMPAKMRFSN